MQARTRRLSLAEGIAAGTLFGVASILIRFLPFTNAYYIAFWRLVLACITLLTVLILFRKPFNFISVRKNLKELLVLSFFLGLHFILFASAVKDTTILNATILVNTSPIFSIFVSSIFFKLRPSRFALLGLVVSFLGVCVIGYAEASGGVTHGFRPTIKGDLEAISAALVESFYLNYGRKVRGQMNILSIMIPMYFFTAAIVGAMSLPITNSILTLPTELSVVLPLLGLGILPTAIAHTLYFSSLSNLKSFETATLAFLEPVGATILAIALFQEVPMPLFIVGSVLVLMGIFFVAREKNSEVRNPSSLLARN